MNEPSTELLLALGKVSFWWNQMHVNCKAGKSIVDEVSCWKQAQNELTKFKEFKGHYDIKHKVPGI